jgi:fructosamine-3-kinase
LEYAKQIICQHYSCDVTAIKYVGGGSFGYVYKVEIPVSPYNLIVKACRVSGMHLNESYALKTLGNDSLIHIPVVYFTVDATDEIPADFIVEEFVEGTDCFTDFSKLLLSKRKKKAFANNIADCIAHWHSITNDKFGSLESPEYDNWIDFYKPFAEDILTTAIQMNKDGLLNNKTLDTMKIAWEHFDYIFSEPIESASLIHGDLNVMNVMSDKNLNITAIIDPLECKWADKEFDLFQLRNLTGEFFNPYETYKSKYPVSSKCDLKCAFYAVYHEVYCFISSGTHTEFILRMTVRRLNKEMKKVGLI